MSATLHLDGSNLSLDAIRRLVGPENPNLAIRPAVRRRVAKAAGFVEEILASGETVYGITTGFGRLANVRIGPEDLGRLQEKLIISHAAGVGDPLPIVEARLAVAIRAATLAAT